MHTMKMIRLLLLLAAPLCFLSCEKGGTLAAKGDVTFAKNTFESLVKGDSAVSTKIDWATFTSLGNNIGAAYSALPTSVDKEKFTTLFITQFATSFRESGGTINDFSNWRVTAHDATKTDVAADSPKGALLITVSERDGVERVSAINIVR